MSSSEPEHKLAPIRREGYFGGVGLLAADARVVLLFADEARRRALQRLLGISRVDKSGLETLIVLALLAGATRRRVEAVPKPSTPTLPSALAGVGLVKEAAYGIAGPWARESPYFGTLLVFAVMGASVRFGVRASTRGVRSLSHQARTEFDHRYGHLIRPNRPRRSG